MKTGWQQIVLYLIAMDVFPMKTNVSVSWYRRQVSAFQTHQTHVS